MSEDNIPAAAGGDGDTLFKSFAGMAIDFNSMSAASVAAYNFENIFSAADSASVFNEAGFTAPKKVLVFREVGLSIANINAIIIHANITDDNAQQILSEITKANRDLTSADNIYEILDDWNDNKLTGRDGAGTVSTGFTNLFAQKNKFRPEWTQTGADFAVVGGVLQQRKTVAENRIETPSIFATGTWEIGYTRTNVTTGYSILHFMSTDKDNSLSINIHQNNLNIFRLIKRVASGESIIINGTWSNDANPHTLKVTRDGSSNLEIFEDNVSKGTVTDSTYITSAKIIFSGKYADSDCNWDNLKVY